MPAEIFDPAIFSSGIFDTTAIVRTASANIEKRSTDARVAKRSTEVND